MSQSHFRDALFDPSLLPQGLVSYNTSDPAQRFAVYRNNVMVSLIEALAAKFPCVLALVGDDFFRAMARIFVRAKPPGSRIMADYGAEFPAFIAGFAPAAVLPYLADVARLELVRGQAYHAADAVSCTAGDFAAVDQERLFDVTLKLHPSAQIIVSRYAVFSLWAAHQGALKLSSVAPDMPETVLICRPELEVEVTLLPDATAEFLSRLGQGQSIGEAASTPDLDLAAAFHTLLTSGVVAEIYPPIQT